jgi:phage recombination protein Bet
MSSTQLVATATPARVSLVQKFAHRFSIDPAQLLPILKATAFQVKGGEVSNEQMAALLVVADQYGLNPFTKEIFAFPDKQNGIVPVVGVDGWSRIINDHPQADGLEFRYAEEILNLPDAQPCPAWCEVVIYRKDRGHPIVVREYLEECYRPAFQRQDGSKGKGPWQTHTRRFLRHKTLIQGGRIAFGFGGIYDEDEATRIVEAEAVTISSAPPVRGTAALAAARDRAQAAETVPDAQGATQEEPKADAPPPAVELPSDAPAAPSAEESSLADCVAFLGTCSTDDEVSTFANDAPAAVRADDRFTKAVAARIAEIKRPKAKK